MSEIERAINFLIGLQFQHKDKAYAVRHFEVALTALREKQKRDKGCWTCCEVEKTGFANMGSRIHLERNETGYSISDRYDNAVEVCYCPKCGKKLEVEHD